MVTNTNNCTESVLFYLDNLRYDLSARRLSTITGYSETTVKKGVCFLRKRGYKIITTMKSVNCNGRVARIAYYRIES